MTPRASHYRAALLALSLALSACTSIEVALGTRTRLQDMPVRALSASLSPGPGLAPGRSARLIVIATTEDGKQHITVGPGHGDVLFDSFGFDARIAQVSAKGVVTLPADPRLSEGQTPHVRINALGHPGVSAELDIPVRYDVAYVADFSGRAGTDGFPGSNGASGMTGNSGSIDATHPAPGGDGTRGDDGGNAAMALRERAARTSMCGSGSAPRRDHCYRSASQALSRKGCICSIPRAARWPSRPTAARVAEEAPAARAEPAAMAATAFHPASAACRAKMGFRVFRAVRAPPAASSCQSIRVHKPLSTA